MEIKNIEGFRKWLENHGCEILPLNDYEVLRWRGAKVGVIYTTGKTSGNYADIAILSWKKNRKWNGGPISTGRNNSYRKEKAQLILRDGDRCFYCGLELMDDITLEHLIALNKGGKNNLENMVLAHEQCNKDAGVLPVAGKVLMAINNRLMAKLDQTKINKNAES